MDGVPAIFMDKLKLIAFDAEDLAVLSAHAQDAVLKVGDMAYLPGEKRFAAVMNRFNWSRALRTGKMEFQRRQSAVRFEHVLKARTSGLDLNRKADVLALLAVQFEATGADDPAGTVTLTFAGNGVVQLEVECIEAELRDLGLQWRTRRRPRHLDE